MDWMIAWRTHRRYTFIHCMRVQWYQHRLKPTLNHRIQSSPSLEITWKKKNSGERIWASRSCFLWTARFILQYFSRSTNDMCVYGDTHSFCAFFSLAHFEPFSSCVNDALRRGLLIVTVRSMSSQVSEILTYMCPSSSFSRYYSSTAHAGSRQSRAFARTMPGTTRRPIESCSCIP